MMKLTRASQYALQALAHYVRLPAGTILASHKVAQEEDIPERFLLKVLKPLVTARILRSVKGPNGGYSLSRSAKDISILEVVEAVDGPIRGEAPAVGSGGNGLDKRLQAVCDDAAKGVRERLGKTRLSELAKAK
jgi:Rrf2 family protein